MGFIRRQRRLHAGLIVLALATAGLIGVVLPGAPSAVTLADQPDPAPQVVDSRSLSGTPMIQGRLLGSDGMPIANAWLLVTAWPNSQTLTALPDGAQVPIEVIAKTKSDRNGNYQLRPPALAALRRFADAAGNVNFEVRALGTPQSISLSFDRHLVDVPGGAVLARPDESSEAVVRQRSLPGSVSAQNVDLRPTPGFEQAVTSSATPPVTKADPPVTECGYPTRVKTYAAQWDIVGQLYSTVTSGFSGTFTYTNGSSSSLGVGASFSGAFGSFSANGTASQSSTLTTIFPSFTGSGGRYYKTQFIYSLFKWHCAGYKFNADGTMYWAVWDEYRAKPTGYAGGAAVSTVPAINPPNVNFCKPYIAGSTFILDKSSAVRWTSGMSMAGTLGINLSSQTGYNTAARIAVKFTATRHVCGTNDVPAGNPRQVIVAP